MEDGFLELILSWILKNRMLLRRKDMRRAEKYAYDRQYQCVNQAVIQDRVTGGAWRAYKAPQMVIQKGG